MPLPQPAERLNNRPTDPAGRRHVWRRGALEQYLPVADLQLAGGTIGQKNDFHGDLVTQPQHVGRICPRRLEPHGVTFLQCGHDIFQGGGPNAEMRICARVVVQAPSNLPDGAVVLVAT